MTLGAVSQGLLTILSLNRSHDTALLHVHLA